jgi:hypothetical protein
MLSKNPANHYAELGPSRFLYRPVNRDVAPNRFHEFARDYTKILVTEHFDGAVVHLKGIIECQLFVRKPEILTTALRRAHLLG